jgi:hypothetical protein
VVGKSYSGNPRIPEEIREIVIANVRNNPEKSVRHHIEENCRYVKRNSKKHDSSVNMLSDERILLKWILEKQCMNCIQIVQDVSSDGLL